MSENIFSGKSAVVTGGSRGIGNAVVSAFLEGGAKVCYLSRNRAENHEQLAEKAQNQHSELLWLSADMADESSITTAMDAALNEFGGLDILVNNAGITRDGLLMRMKISDWNDVISVNLTGAFIACRSVVRSMAKARSGVIINISSVVGLIGNAGQANYAASKAGLIGFSKSLAKEFSSRSVRVNVVAPGYV
ncbi:MAG: SDR family NAD(P)-dependent oxidoreductase, partial [Spirochaetales bacterium]|nr:SDR family NAD(P)-dependent oxidoreductase [Spirochaetales bacterium]